MSLMTYENSNVGTCYVCTRYVSTITTINAAGDLACRPCPIIYTYIKYVLEDRLARHDETANCNQTANFCGSRWTSSAALIKLCRDERLKQERWRMELKMINNCTQQLKLRENFLLPPFLLGISVSFVIQTTYYLSLQFSVALVLLVLHVHSFFSAVTSLYTLTRTSLFHFHCIFCFIRLFSSSYKLL